MSTTNEEDFDYQGYTRDNPPDLTKIHRGPEARERRRATAMQHPAVHIGQDIFAQFQERIAPGQSAEQAINQALREWLAAKDLKELIRAELHDAVQEAFIQVGVDLPSGNTERLNTP